MSESPFYPYPPRPGTHTEALSMDEGHEPLTPEDQAAVLQFEQDLYALNLSPSEFPQAESYRHNLETAKRTLEPFETTWLKKINSIDIDASYFLTEPGKQAWQEATGHEITSETIEECKKELSGQDLRAIDSKILDELEAESIGYIESSLTNAFIENDYKGEALPSPSIITLYKNPEIIAEKASAYRALKGYLVKAKADLLSSTHEQNPQTDGKLLFLDLYRKRVNTFLAEEYAIAYKVLRQYQLSGNSPTHTKSLEALEAALPAFDAHKDNRSIAEFLQRVDRYKNGIDADENGQYIWNSSEADRLMDLAAHPSTKEDQPVDRGLYADIDPAALKSTIISGTIFGEWVESVLKEYEVLSEVGPEEWSSERVGPAADNKWQVIVSSKFKSLAVDDKQRIVKVPNKDADLLSAVALINHEITHVLQHENKRAIGKLAILKSIGLDNVSEQTESGGKGQEKVAREALSGKIDHRIAGTGYYKALEVKARGGSYGEVVQAYYDALQSDSSNLSKEKAAAQSVNRARRIFRVGGFEYAQDNEFITNTQPLSYLEQGLIYDSLDEEQRRMLFIGGVTIRNLVRLSNAGLIDMDKISIPEHMPYELLYPKVKELVDTHKTA